MIMGEPIFQKNSDEEQMEAIINIVGDELNSPELKERKNKGKGWNAVRIKYFYFCLGKTQKIMKF